MGSVRFGLKKGGGVRRDSHLKGSVGPLYRPMSLERSKAESGLDLTKLKIYPSYSPMISTVSEPDAQITHIGHLDDKAYKNQ